MSKDSTYNNNQPKGIITDDADHQECMRILSLVLDEEATPEQREYYNKHLKDCMPYYEIYNLDLAIKDLIKKNCAGQPVPSDLAQSIRAKIFASPEQ